MPMLAVTKCSPAASTIGWLIDCATRSATPIASCAPSSCSQTTRNSSPPSRATVSDGRTASCSRGASATSRSSPAWWPIESLTSLNWSRSASRTATARPSRRRRASAPSSRSSASARFGSPVSGSCIARCRTSSSTRLRSTAEEIDVRDGAQELGLVRGVAARRAGVRAEHAPDAVARRDRHHDARPPAGLGQRGREREARLRGDVGGGDGHLLQQRVAGLRLRPRRGRARAAPAPRASRSRRRAAGPSRAA